MSTWEFKTTYLDEDGYKIESDVIIVEIEDTDNPESDQFDAYVAADEKAEKAKGEWGADGFEISLATVY